MKRFQIQIQPALAPELDVEAAVARLQALAEATVTHGEDAGSFINIDFLPAEASPLWAAVRNEVKTDSALAACSIICCEGDRSWDDYRLLHHYDPALELDDVN